jgi:DNA-binding NarL/FixJ family response regulator
MIMLRAMGLMITFLLIDNHELLRLGIRFALEGSFPDAQILEAGSLAPGLACLHGSTHPTLVLLDLDLSIAGGDLTALQAIRLACPGVPVVIVSGAADHKFVNRCFALGADGFVSKSSGSAQVVADT